MIDDDHELNNSNVNEAESGNSEELSKHYQHHLKEFNGWEEKRSSLLTARFEEEVFSHVHVHVVWQICSLSVYRLWTKTDILHGMC